ncbi:putative small heat shock protein HSP20 [Helianthus annuus]|uniref:Putative HSP20-like chaperone n=1 Tax=Helianthus annuus TaxID=4232 RepID=A0A251S687_HELAN|nr:15.4 kDa class V heat shock protein [Helianthus annuus]KAF5763451.1 putative small heat shock protein HSP20 [Helianthus annuus]KAJ0472104.1 putative small heat shock protein HSP20 [Helianthus annuus]
MIIPTTHHPIGNSIIINQTNHLFLHSSFVNLVLISQKSHISWFLYQEIICKKGRKMEFSTFNPSWHSFFTSPLLFPYPFVPENYVHWTETPESHIYSADIPGVRKEEICVEVEDSRYLIIRTESADDTVTTAGGRTFMKKFRLPDTIDVNGISACYENGVLTVTVPRSFVRRGFYIEPADLPQQTEVLARAA